MITPYMNMPSPVPTITPGADWSYDIASCLSIIDSHNHSSGNGNAIQPNGININTDLAFNSNNATLLKSTRYSAQVTPITSASPNVGCVYVSGNELYYNDVSGGNQIQITNNGSVNAGAGSISGLPSGTASVAFSGSTYTFQSATNVAGSIDGRNLILRNSTASSFGLTLSPPTAMGAGFSLVLPSIPASQSFLTLDTSGNIAAYASINQGIQRTNLVAVGQQISSSSGGFSSVGAGTIFSPVDVTNLSVTITTSGRPVMIMIIPDGDGGGSFVSIGAAVATSVLGALVLYRATPQAYFLLSSASNSGTGTINTWAPGSFSYLDAPSAGTYTYSIKVYSVNHSDNAEIGVLRCKLVAYEL